MNRGRIAVYVTLLFGVLLAFTACRQGEGDRALAQSHLSPLTSSRPSSPGLRAWVDPQTGALGAPPESEIPLDPSGTAASFDALEMEPGRTRAGGKMVDLRGRFVYSRRASVLPDGSLVSGCEQGDGGDHAQ
jgi:hypothetical protein